MPTNPKKVHQKPAAVLKTTFRALQYRNFRLFWFGQCISLTGTWMQRTAQTWLVYTLTKSPLLVGMLGVFQFAPMLLFSLFAGVVADRFSKKKILLFTQTVFMLQAVVLTVLTFSGHVLYWHVFLLSAVFGFMQTLDMPARQSFFIDLVGRENLTNAISLNSTIVNLARIMGPAVSGLVMLRFGIVFCFFVNAVSFLPVLAGILLIRVPPAAHERMPSHMLSDIRDGIAYIGKNQVLVLNVLVMAVVCTLAMNNDVIIPVFAKAVLGRGAEGYTGLLSLAGFGAFAGAVLMAYQSRKGLRKGLLLVSGAATAVLQIFTVFSREMAAAGVLLCLIGFFNLLFINTANSIFQLNSSDEYRGRVMSVYSFLNQGSTPVGNFLAGYVMEKAGGDSGFLFCGAATLLLFAAVLLAKHRTARLFLPQRFK